MVNPNKKDDAQPFLYHTTPSTNPQKDRSSAFLFLAWIGIVVFLILVWFFYNRNQQEEKTPETPNKETLRIITPKPLDDKDLVYEDNDYEMKHFEWPYWKAYTPWFIQGDGFESQWNPKKIKEAREKREKELKDRFPNITQEELDLLIWEINGYGWNVVTQTDDGKWLFGSKYFVNVNDLENEFIKRLWTAAFMFYPKNRDWFIQNKSLNDMWYDLTERSKELDEKILASWNPKIADLENEIKSHWGKIYVPNPNYKLDDNKNQQRDVYFYQTLSNLNNSFKNLAEVYKDILRPDEKEALNNVKFVLAQHNHVYRAYPIDLPNSVAQKIDLKEFDLTFFYVDNNNGASSLANNKPWEAVFGSFFSIEDLQPNMHKAREWEMQPNFDKTFTFDYDDNTNAEWDKLANYLYNRRLELYPVQSENDMQIKTLEDNTHIFKDNITLRCYVGMVDDDFLKAKIAEWRHCLIYQKNNWKLLGMVSESDTAQNNSLYRADTNLIPPTWFKKDQIVLTPEEEAQNKKVDELYNIYFQEEAQAIIDQHQKDLEKTAKDNWFESVEAMKAFEASENKKIQDMNYKYDEQYDYSKYQQTSTI